MNGDELNVAMSTLTVRPYVAADCDATIDLFLRAIREVASKDYSQAQVDAWAHVDDPGGWARRRSSRPTWIAERNRVPVGFSDLEPDGHLDMLFVHPDFQGIGAAGLLLATVEAEAAVKGLRRVFTEASLTARPFFECKGFVTLARQSVEKRGQTLTNFRMEKSIR
jgi:putative acetyltransferase